MRYKAKVSYDGNSYYGFQRLNELLTIQKELEDLKRVNMQEIAKISQILFLLTL